MTDLDSTLTNTATTKFTVDQGAVMLLSLTQNSRKRPRGPAIVSMPAAHRARNED